jgi:sec-independent protein translocase protein TatC
VVSDSYLTFTEHLEELRWCLLRALAAVVVASLACYFFADAIFAVMVDPLKQILPPGQNLIGTTVTEAFFTEIKVSFLAGVLFSSPFVFYEVWRFIRPGLIGNESRLVIPFVLCATLFFLGGAYFCYRIVLPVAFSYFIEQYGTLGVTPAIRLGE